MHVLQVLRHDDMLSFIRRYYFFEISWVLLGHYLITVLFLGLWVRTGIDAGYGIGEWVGAFGWAVVVFIVLIPLHEMVHGAVYWALGAKDIRFHVSFRNAYAYAIAHRHVVSGRQMVWLAVAPFIVVTAFLAAILSILPGQAFVIVAALLLHTIGCAGDWAMMNYVWSVRRTELYVYDDADEGVTCFVTPSVDERS